MLPEDLSFSVSQFVAIFNQAIDIAFPEVVIVGELANFRVSKNRWVYFDLKDETSSVKFFGTVYQLPGPLEDGMLLRVKGQPRLHNLYGFSVNILNIAPAGEGSLKKAADLLKAKLIKEGLFDEDRKRLLPYPPQTIGLVTSRQSAAYADFIKVLGARWGGINIKLIDVQVQGEVAPGQIVAAIEQFNATAEPPEVIVLCRGGGSAEDLAAFNTESVTRAVAASRVPTLVAIGHEIDISLAELAADSRASTPSNAAELLVPDRKHVRTELNSAAVLIERATTGHIRDSRRNLADAANWLQDYMADLVEDISLSLKNQRQLLEILNPQAVLRRGYAVVRDKAGNVVRDSQKLATGDIVDVKLAQGGFNANVNKLK